MRFHEAWFFPSKHIKNSMRNLLLKGKYDITKYHSLMHTHVVNDEYKCTIK